MRYVADTTSGSTTDYITGKNDLLTKESKSFETIEEASQELLDKFNALREDFKKEGKEYFISNTHDPKYHTRYVSIRNADRFWQGVSVILP